MLYFIFTYNSAGEASLLVLFAYLVLIQVMALLLDRVFGEPRRFHPLVAFGRLSYWVEQRLNTGENWHVRLLGFLAWCVCILPLVLICILLLESLAGITMGLYWAASALILYFTLGLRSLAEHARWVAEPLGVGDLSKARDKVSWLVSRETHQMDTEQASKACIESVLENGNDAVFGALFWFLIAGAPGALLYRFANTLDASWGYRNQRFRDFGWWAARTDDWLNYIPARICACYYSLVGNTFQAFKDWRIADQWRRNEGLGFASPNAGIVMASGAGALGVGLGGIAVYEGVKQYKPPLGSGSAPLVEDIERAINLLNRSVVLFIVTKIIFLMLAWFFLFQFK